MTKIKMTAGALVLAVCLAGVWSVPARAHGKGHGGHHGHRECGLKDGSVTTRKIRDGAVTEPKLADGAVTGQKIRDGSIGAEKLNFVPGGGVPSGFMVLGNTTVPAPGYSLVRVGALKGGDRWETLATMPTARVHPTTSLIGGKVYLIGGHNGAGGDLAVVEEYDPAGDSWRTRTPMPTARHAAAAAVVDGKIYVFGGHNGNLRSEVEEYDPATDAWTSRAPLPTPRHHLSASVVGGKVYVVGGTGGYDVVEEYDPALDLWSRKAPMPTCRGDHSAVVAGGKIYVIGGWYSQSTGAVEVYDPATDSWSSGAPMPTRRLSMASALVEGKIYVLGGINDAADLSKYRDNVEVYDPAADAWTVLPSMPAPRCYAPGAIVDGMIHVFGGQSLAEVPLDSHEAYETPFAYNLFAKD